MSVIKNRMGVTWEVAQGINSLLHENLRSDPEEPTLRSWVWGYMSVTPAVGGGIGIGWDGRDRRASGV